MTRAAHLLTLLGVVAVPLLGWFAADWSGATTLAVYWFETVVACVFIAARVALHQRWAPRRGHFRYEAPAGERRGSGRASFVTGFMVTSGVFCAAHALFLGAILFLLNRNGVGGIVDIDWRSVAFGVASVLLFVVFDFVVDLLTLRRWTFWDIEQTANRGLSRVVVVHLTIVFGFVAIALTDAPAAFFGVFVVLKTLVALGSALPQYEPATAPAWFARIMNRVPNVHPGRTFEEFWAKDRADEVARRDRNERPWETGRRRPAPDAA